MEKNKEGYVAEILPCGNHFSSLKIRADSLINIFERPISNNEKIEARLKKV